MELLTHHNCTVGGAHHISDHLQLLPTWWVWSNSFRGRQVDTSNAETKVSHTFSEPFQNHIWYMYIYSGTSSNGHSEERTTSLQWTNCVPPANNCSMLEPPKKGQPPNNGQNSCPQRVHCSEVPLYIFTAMYLICVYTYVEDWKSCALIS